MEEQQKFCFSWGDSRHFQVKDMEALKKNFIYIHYIYNIQYDFIIYDILFYYKHIHMFYYKHIIYSIIYLDYNIYYFCFVQNADK